MDRTVKCLLLKNNQVIVSEIVEVGSDLPETPEGYRMRLKEERLALAKNQFIEDPFVSALTERFDATVRTESIEPRNGGTHV